MADYRTMYDRDFFRARNLSGGDVVVTISRIEGAQVGRPILYIEEEQRAFCLDETAAKAIAALYGDETDDWIGKRIALYPGAGDRIGVREHDPGPTLFEIIQTSRYTSCESAIRAYEAEHIGVSPEPQELYRWLNVKILNDCEDSG